MTGKYIRRRYGSGYSQTEAPFKKPLPVEGVGKVHDRGIICHSYLADISIPGEGTMVLS